MPRNHRHNTIAQNVVYKVLDCGLNSAVYAAVAPLAPNAPPILLHSTCKYASQSQKYRTPQYPPEEPTVCGEISAPSSLSSKPAITKQNSATGVAHVRRRE